MIYDTEMQRNTTADTGWLWEIQKEHVTQNRARQASLRKEQRGCILKNEEEICHERWDRKFLRGRRRDSRTSGKLTIHQHDQKENKEEEQK